MKKFLFLLPILFISCTTPLTKNPTATATITGIYQEYYPALDDYGYVDVFFDFRNTGDCLIDYYEIYFEVTCTDNSKYTDWTNGVYVMPGEVEANYATIYTQWKPYASVRITKIELKSHWTWTFIFLPISYIIIVDAKNKFPLARSLFCYSGSRELSSLLVRPTNSCIILGVQKLGPWALQGDFLLYAK